MNTLPLKHWSFLLRASGTFCGLAAASIMLAQSANQSANPTSSEITGRIVTGSLVLSGTVNLSQIAAANKLAPVNSAGPELNRSIPFLRPPRSPNPNLQPSASTPGAALSAMASAPLAPVFGTFKGFNGLSHADQRNAGGGNQFSLEPPDQALAVGNGFVVEGVNDAFNIYNKSGKPLLAAPVTANQFFNLPPVLVRPTGTPYGPFLTDPVLLYDSTTQRFFAIMGDIESNGLAPESLASTRLRIAVSQSADPTGAWTIFTLDTTDALNSDGKGARFPDYEKISFDQNGFYITSDQFQIFPGVFFGNYIGVAIRAISKSALEQVGRIAPPPVVEFDIAYNPTSSNVFNSLFDFVIWPAKTPPGQPFSQLRGGSQYFISADTTDFNGTQVAIWTMFNTSSLNTSTPQLHLGSSVVGTGTYFGATVGVQQKPGPLPLGMALCGCPNPTLPTLDPGDAFSIGIDSVNYANGRLWGTLGTQVIDAMGHPRMAVYFMMFQQSAANPTVFTLAAHKVISKTGASLLRPSVGVNKDGRGAIVFTLVGPNNYPSSAFTPIDNASIGPITIAKAGAVPEDGFTGYPPDQTPPFNTARWGDYSWTAVDDADQKTVWLATEYIPNVPRTVNANWGTFITEYILP
jgi:hypothetical protein